MSVKEAVLPFDRFQGADALLGPEMRSTGEVMGVARDFPAAFAKAQAAAGRAAAARRARSSSPSPTRDKPAAVGIAAQLHDLGFAIVATRGTASAISRMGIPVERINKLGEGSPHVVDWIERGDVDLVINTPTGTAARADGYEIRRAAVARGMPCITTISGGMAAARAIAAAAGGRAARDLAAGAARVGAARAGDARAAGRAAADRMLAPLGRRLVAVRAAGALGAYVVLSCDDPDGPAPGRRPVLHARRRRAVGRRRRRAPVPAARLLGRCGATPTAGSTSCSRTSGRARARLAELGRATGCGCSGRSAAASARRAPGAAPMLAGGGVGIAPLAIWQDDARRRRALVLLGFRDAAHAEGAALLRGARVATDDGSAGHQGS